VVVDFDLLGIQVTLSGRDAGGGGGGAYDDGDLDGHTILVDGTDKLTFQVGPAGTSNDVAEISMSDMRATGTTLNLADVSLLTIGDAQTALSFIQQAQAEVVGDRNRIASFQNRLEMSIETSDAVMEGMIAAEQNIREADFAKLVTQMTRSQILAQVATSISVEADTDIDRILTLLQ
jgi:flagellin